MGYRYELLPTQNSSFTGVWHFSGKDIMYNDFNHTLVGGVLQVIIVRPIRTLLYVFVSLCVVQTHIFCLNNIIIF